MIYKVRRLVAEDWGWVNDQVPLLQVEDTNGIVCTDGGTGDRAAAMVLDNVTPTTVQVHFMVKDLSALRHGFHRDCFDLVFNHLGKRTMYGLVPANNEKAIKLNKHMGFTIKCVMEEAFSAGIDYLLMELKRENCKYLRKPRADNGQKVE